MWVSTTWVVSRIALSGKHCSAPAHLEELISGVLSGNILQPSFISTLWVYNSVGYSWHVTPQSFLPASFLQCKRNSSRGECCYLICTLVYMFNIRPINMCTDAHEHTHGFALDQHLVKQLYRTQEGPCYPLPALWQISCPAQRSCHALTHAALCNAKQVGPCSIFQGMSCF